MTFEEYLSSLKGKTVGVIGVGVSNRPLIEKLLERGIDVTARDKKEDLGELGQALTAQGCKLRLGVRKITRDAHSVRDSVKHPIRKILWNISSGRI